MTRSSLWVSLVLLAVAAGCSRAKIRPDDRTIVTRDPAPSSAAASPGAAKPAAADADGASATPREEGSARAAPPAAPPPAPVVRFAFDSATLSPEACAELDRFAAAWTAGGFEQRLLIEGHADERGTEEYNLVLGQKRAASVTRYLAALGLSQQRLDTISFGESRPAAAGSDEAAHRANRRAELKVDDGRRSDARRPRGGW